MVICSWLPGIVSQMVTRYPQLYPPTELFVMLGDDELPERWMIRAAWFAFDLRFINWGPKRDGFLIQHGIANTKINGLKIISHNHHYIMNSKLPVVPIHGSAHFFPSPWQTSMGHQGCTSALRSRWWGPGTPAQVPVKWLGWLDVIGCDRMWMVVEPPYQP